jgi:hypothetical protein
MMPVKARLRMHGSQSQWKVTLPVCRECDFKMLNALSSSMQAIKPKGYVSETMTKKG